MDHLTFDIFLRPKNERYPEGYIGLIRAYLLPSWPITLCSGITLAFANYGGFSWLLAIKVTLVGFFGFETDFVLNDYVDRNRLDVENTLTRHWMLFKERPIP